MTLVACGLSVWLLVALCSVGVEQRQQQQQQGGNSAAAAHADHARLPSVSSDDALLRGCDGCTSMAQAYAQLSGEFAAEGLDGDTVRAIQPWFHGIGTDSNEPIRPKLYSEFPSPIPPGAVRLLVLPLGRVGQFVDAAAEFVADWGRLLPEGTQDVRPEPLRRGAGLIFTVGVPLPANVGRPGPGPHALADEADAVADVCAGGIKAPALTLDRVTMTRSGTLVVGRIDTLGRVLQLRSAIAAKFPGATTHQASIAHTTLARILSDAPFPGATIDAVSNLCDR